MKPISDDFANGGGALGAGFPANRGVAAPTVPIYERRMQPDRRPAFPASPRPASARLAAAAASAGLLLACVLLLPPAPPALAAGADSPAPGVLATDGYFDVSRIDPDTYSIREPHYWQQNIAYVLKGETRAILFDSGSGTRDIAFVADKVTKKPMTVLASHVHYDHIGSHRSFQQVAMVDLPMNREATSDNWFSPPVSRSLWAFTRGFAVTEWWKPGDVIDLGGRRVEVVHLPGHSPDSIALVERETGYAFVGDHLYGGPLLANLPGSDLAAYLESTRRLLRDYPEIRTVYGAHWQGKMTRESLEALERALSDILGKRAQGRPLWWLGWTASEYPGDGFRIYAP
jgi:hydroxyacylglutathione hydrolase